MVWRLLAAPGDPTAPEQAFRRLPEDARAHLPPACCILPSVQQGPGPRPYDVSPRYLIEGDPRAWLTWVGLPVNGPVQTIDSEVSTVLADVDKVLRVEAPTPWLAHFEFQASRDLHLPFRLLQYHALLLRRHELPVESTVVLLRPAADGPEMSGIFVRRGATDNLTIRFAFWVIRLWERPVDELLEGGLGIAPLAPLAAVEPAEIPAIIQRLTERFSREADPAGMADLWAATQLLLGLRYDDDQIRGWVRTMSWMRESSMYEAIVGRREREVQEGRLSEARRLVLAVGTDKLGAPDAATVNALDAIDDVERLERMIRRILWASSWREYLGPESVANSANSSDQ